MAHAYTPGLRVTKDTMITKSRILPLKGEVLKSKGDHVTRDEIVAETNLPGKVTPLNLINQLGIMPSEIHEFMLKKEGDSVEKGEVIAETKFFIKFLRTSIQSPLTGTIESISEVTGQVLFREPPRPVNIKAYIDGVVTEVVPEEGVSIETKASFIQGIFGVGGETSGEIVFAVDSPEEVLDSSKITDEFKGKIVIGGAFASSQAIKAAQKAKLSGLIVGGIRDSDLRDLLGYDLGVAITGHEDIGLTLVLTEGFGEIAMADRTFMTLKEREGAMASISGATQIRAGVIRPEIIVPYSGGVSSVKTKVEIEEKTGMMPGDQVRVIRKPFFGKIGTVKSLPSELAVVESETKVRVLEVEFSNGNVSIIPRANVELIEE